MPQDHRPEARPRRASTTPARSAEFGARLGRARQGESEAIDWLCAETYTRVQERVHRELAQDIRIGRPWLLARFSTGDIVQEVFLGLLRDLSAFRGRSEDAFIGYLSMMIRNRIVDSIRFHEAARRDGRQSREESAAAGHPAAGTDVEQQLQQRELDARYRTALESFPERERTLLRGRIEQELQFDELARCLDYGTASTARKAFYSALARLSVRLKPGEDGQ